MVKIPAIICIFVIASRRGTLAEQKAGIVHFQGKQYPNIPLPNSPTRQGAVEDHGECN